MKNCYICCCDPCDCCKLILQGPRGPRGLKGDSGNGVFVYRPGYTGSASNIFSDWQTLYTAMSLVEGPKDLYFDATNGSPTIPAGTWDMKDTTWKAQICLFTGLILPVVVVQEGAQISNLCVIQGPMIVEYQGTTNPLISVDSSISGTLITLILRDGAAIVCSGTQPFVQLDNGLFAIVLDTGASIQYGTTAAVVSNDSGFFQGVVILVGQFCNVADQSVAGSGAVSFSLIGPDAGVSQDSGTAFPGLTVNYAFGQIQYRPNNLASWQAPPPTTLSDAVDRLANYVAGIHGPIA